MVKTMKNRKGFTLIELLGVIVIISIVLIVVYFISIDNVDNAKNILDKTEQKLVLEAAELFAKEYRDTSDWKEYIDKNNNSSFCVSLATVINKGYYKASDKKIIEMSKNYVVYFEVTNGVYNKKIININEEDNPCVGYIGSSELKDPKKNITYEEDNTKIISLDVDVEKTGEYTYNTKTTLDINKILGNIEITTPVYVALIMDASGSMSGTKLQNALNAAKSMANNILNSNQSSYVSLVKYNDVPTIVRDFEHNNLNSVTINTINGGGTNTSGAIDTVTRMFSKIKDKNAKKYVVILYDGDPTSYTYIQNNGKKLTPIGQNSNLYFDKVINTNQSLSNYSNTSSANYVISSAKYLTNYNNEGKYYPNLITIGYEFKQNNIELKKISTSDNELCNNSDYAEPANGNIIYSNTGESNSKKLELVDNPIFLPFKYDSNSKTLISSNDNIVNSISYGYLEYDLSSKSTSDYYKLDFNISYKGKVGYEAESIFGEINVSENKTLDKNPLYNSCYAEGSSGTWGNLADKNPNNICFKGTLNNKTYSISVKGGKKYYIHLFNVRDDTNSSSSYFKINYINITDTNSGQTLINTDFSNFNGNNIASVSTKDQSKVVYGFNQSGNTSSLSFNTYGKLGYSMLPIDLTNSNSKDVFIAGTTTSVSGNSENTKKYVIKLAGSTKKEMYKSDAGWGNAFLEISSNYYRSASGKYNYFKLDNGKTNYLHYYFDSGYAYPANYYINSMSLYKRGDKLDNLGFDFNVNNNYDTLVSSNIIKNDTKASTGFILDNNNLISGNKELANTYAHSYIKIDLSKQSASNYYAISTKYNLIEKSHLENQALIIISKSTSINNIKNLTATNNYGENILLAGYDYNIAEERYGIVNGGSVYYVHFIYVKADNKNTYLTINNVNVYNASKIKDYSNSDLIHGKDYSFITKNGSLVSSNDEVNSMSHSYIKVDLSKKSSSEQYRLLIKDKINSNTTSNSYKRDYGSIVLTTSSNFPEENLSAGDRGIINFIEYEIDGKKSLEHVQLLNGGKVYYVHFMFSKEKGDTDSYFSINNISLIKVENQTNRMDLSKLKVLTDNLSFNQTEDNKYVANTTKNYITSSYTKVDLTNYPNDEFIIDIYGTDLPENNGYSNGSGNVFITNSNQREYYCVHYAYEENNCHNFTNYSNTFSYKVKGGKVYYIHYVNGSVSYREEETFSFEVNKVNVYKITGRKYYCYYESTSGSINTLLKGISKNIIENVPKMKANSAKIILNANKNLIIKKGNKEVTKITYDINLNDNNTNINDNFDIKIGENALNNCNNKSECTIQLFDKISIEVYDQENNIIKTIEVTEGLPNVTIKRESFDTLN